MLVLGGGFAGLSTARAIARSAQGGMHLGLRVVDRAEAMTFWPMVPEVIPGDIQAAHVMRPLREELVDLGAEFTHAEVTGGDLHKRVIETSIGAICYDRLVIALGWQTAFFGTPGASDHCLTLHSLADAVTIRNRVIGQFEAAAAGRPHDLSFVVVGGGSTGVELASAVADLVDILMPQYPTVADYDLHIVLTQARDDVLPHMEKPLRQAAASRLRDDRIDVRTEAKVSAVDARGVTLESGSRIAASTVMWAAGVEASSVARQLRGAQLDGGGRIQVDDCLRVRGVAATYALGDISAAHTDGRHVAPTAQAAVQESGAVARNLLAELEGVEPTPFEYRQLGRLVELGGRFAVSEVLGTQISGWAGHVLWRAVYLYKLGDWRDRLHVAADWLIGLVERPSVPRLRIE
ncbi:MAG TPA: FAD-dependent oxidoreductase [Candidatus Dormibacteraeota bacterium]|nr:FAD-dependent oxidoreductase [Candidatus Dormibacteraeota bacterium]